MKYILGAASGCKRKPFNTEIPFNRSLVGGTAKNIICASCLGALFYGLNQPAFLVGNWYTASLMFIWVNFYIVVAFKDFINPLAACC